MTTANTLRRSLMIGLASAGLALSIVGPAAAGSSDIPSDAVIVSSTEYGSGAFTMTASNVGDAPISLDLATPGTASNIEVDLGSFNGRWIISDLASGETATMIGSLES